MTFFLTCLVFLAGLPTAGLAYLLGAMTVRGFGPDAAQSMRRRGLFAAVLVYVAFCYFGVGWAT